MKSALIQRNISIMEDVLCGLQEKLVEVKAYRKELNQEIDNLTVEAFGDDEVMMVRKTYMTEAEKCSKFIRKCRKKIKAAEELQRALKLEAKDAARVDAWMKEESYEWSFEAAVSNVPMYCAKGYVGPDGNMVWEE
jgi:hypothetical protein